MKKETKPTIKSDVATGTSSSVGATIGMFIGDALSTEANAAEVHEPLSVPNAPEVEVITTEPIHENAPTPHVEQVTPSTAAESNSEPNVSVLRYETITGDDGSQMDVAVVSVNGQQATIADVDMDGLADIIISDLNGNDSLENNEIIDVTGQGLTMAPFQNTDMPNDSTLIAQNEDYVNDADVTEYMA